jgi:C4-dicarboxylate-specific signal transduction histidine kinase
MSEKQKVLIVDDDTRNQRIITEILEDAVDFRLASTGEDAIAAVEEYCPDLVLLDIMLPGIDGYEVCRRIRSNPKLSFTKVILVSGKARVEERLKGYAIGADDYMTKPAVPEELLAKAKVFLRLTRVENELAQLNRSLEEKVQERTRQLLDAEVKLVNSAKMSALGEMAGGIAHEINTPLGTIGMVGDQIDELIAEDPIDKKMIHEMTQVISGTVQRIGGIIRGLRTFSRDVSQDRFEPIPLKRILEDTLGLCREKLKHGNVQISCDLIPDDLKVYCRAVQISQVLLNLINNACDAILPLPEKWIKVEAKKDGDFAEVFITDSGNGIPEEVRNKIFQPFFTTKDIGKGTGLGLSISRGIVDAHRGSMTLDSQCENTRFILRLPTNQADASQSDGGKQKVAL